MNQLEKDFVKRSSSVCRMTKQKQKFVDFRWECFSAENVPCALFHNSVKPLQRTAYLDDINHFSIPRNLEL